MSDKKLTKIELLHKMVESLISDDTDSASKFFNLYIEKSSNALMVGEGSYENEEKDDDKDDEKDEDKADDKKDDDKKKEDDDDGKDDDKKKDDKKDD